MPAIDLKEVMKIIRSGEWIQLRVITANLSNNTGGKVLELQRCRIARRETMVQNASPVAGISGFSKNARHNQNFTVNMELQNGEIRKIHPALVFEINKQSVL